MIQLRIRVKYPTNDIKKREAGGLLFYLYGFSFSSCKIPYQFDQQDSCRGDEKHGIPAGQHRKI